MDDSQRLAAEALAAVTGIQRLLDVPARPVTATDGRKAIKLAGEVDAIFRDYLSGPKFKRQTDDLPELDYLETLDKLTRPVDDDQREALLSQFTDEQAGLAYLDVMDRGVAWLLEKLPRLSRQTLVGDIPMEPSMTEMAEFERRWVIAADPLQVLRDMQEGIMIDDQVDTLKALFPTLYARFAMSLQGVLLDMRGKDEEWEPPSEKTNQVFSFFGLSPVDPDLAAKLQAQSKAATAAGEGQPGGGGQPIDINIEGMQTQTQRLQNA